MSGRRFQPRFIVLLIAVLWRGKVEFTSSAHLITDKKNSTPSVSPNQQKDKTKSKLIRATSPYTYKKINKQKGVYANGGGVQ